MVHHPDVKNVVSIQGGNKMNCPNPKCPYFKKYGKPYPRAKFSIQKENPKKKAWARQRKKIMKKHRPKGGFKTSATQKEKPREDFNAFCPKCKHKWLEDWAGTRIVIEEGKP